MSTKIASKRGHGEVIQLPTGYVPDGHRVAERKRIMESKRRSIRNHRIIAAAAALAISYGVIEAGRAMLKTPQSAKSHAEAEMLKNVQKSNEAVSVDNRIFVFREGVRWRSTPDMLDPNQDTPDFSNEAGQVGKGQVLIVQRDMVGDADSNADGWEAFRLVNDLNKSEDTASGSPKKLGKDLMWINIDELKGQSTPEGGSFLETYVPNYGPKTPKSLTAHITEKGDILLDFNGKPAALGQIMSTENSNKFLQNYQPDQH